MCIVLNAGVKLSNTIIYAAEVLHPDLRRPVHVLGYQNEVSKTGSGTGPNAMILPIPSAAPLGPENMIDARAAGLSSTLYHYQEAVNRMKPRSRSLSFKSEASTRSVPKSYQVFESGAYTVALAQSAEGLQTALQEVPLAKRPSFSNAMLESLAQAYPDWPIAICCFTNSQSIKPEPLFWWYEPKDTTQLFAPALDAHDGGPPQNKPVDRDHTVIFGSYQAEAYRNGAGVQKYLDSVPPYKRWMLTHGIRGTMVQYATTTNGDFILPLSHLSASSDHLHDYISGNQVKVAPPPGLV